MNEPASESYIRNVERPAAIVRTALRMILGAGLIVAIILKVYMMVLTDHVCAPEEASLGALIRCAGTVSLIGHALALAAAIEAAFGLFIRSRSSVQETLVLTLAAAIVLALARELEGVADWRSALWLGVLTACLLALRTMWTLADKHMGRGSQPDE